MEIGNAGSAFLNMAKSSSVRHRPCKRDSSSRELRTLLVHSSTSDAAASPDAIVAACTYPA
ncbi:hypothetical protein X777_02298 [Ooceraea biroi]|uniref:Uncharacterized protein n=1 Tax=Ooceraea biroi TaxID=2015173 RepID=A0A026WNL5_OOCBI|nr:hypothetical protein X777_02298 [Ooceraea biroi]